MRGAGAHRSGQPTNQRGFRGERACGWFKRRVPRKSVTTSQSWFKCVSHCYENARGLPTRLRCGVTLRGRRHCRHCFGFFFFFSLKARELVHVDSAFFGSPSLLESGGASAISRETSETRRLRCHSSGVRATPQSRDTSSVCVCVCDQNVVNSSKKKNKSQFRGQCLCARARARARLLFRFQRLVLTSFSSSPPSPFIGWGNAAVVADLCHFMARERFHTWCITSLLYVEAVICVQSGPLARVYKSIKHKLRTESPRIVWLAVLLTRYNADVVVVVVVAAVVVVVAQFYLSVPLTSPVFWQQVSQLSQV